MKDYNVSFRASGSSGIERLPVRRVVVVGLYPLYRHELVNMLSLFVCKYFCRIQKPGCICNRVIYRLSPSVIVHCFI